MKIPENAKKVFDGVMFDVYQGEHKMFDGSKQTFEMLERSPSNNVIAFIDDKIMVLIQEQPAKPLFPSLPGGRIEKGSTPLETGKREMLEETDYEAKEWKLLGEWFGASKLYFHESIFIGKNCKKVARQELDSAEKIKVTFMDFDEFLQLCRKSKFTAPPGLKFLMYEALVDSKKKEEFMKKYNVCLCRTVTLDHVEKALAIKDTRGLIRMVLDPKTKIVIGVHIVGPMAADIITTATSAIKNKMTICDIRYTVHVFPTLSEMLKKAAQSFDQNLDEMACCVE